MSGEINPIETRYGGYRFRSRLEARWAVFFDALNIEWEYEAQGYMVDGTPYLPDFWLPKFCPRYNAGEIFDSGMFAEVKPNGGDFSLARRFAKRSSHGIWLCEGVPDFRAYLVCFNDEETYCESPAIPNADQAEGENRMYWQPGYEREDLSIPENCIGMLGFTFTNAVQAARSARFEHGESPR